MSQPPPDIGHLLTARAGEEMALNEAHLNPKLGRIVSTLGVYRQWVHGGVTLLSGVLAEQLLARAPDSVAAMVPANSGTESVEAAIKIARAATGRPRILYAEHAFHGLTLGSLSLNGDAIFREGFGPLLPACASVPFGDADALRDALAQGDVLLGRRRARRWRRRLSTVLTTA